MSGCRVIEEKISGNSYVLEKGELSKGLYLIELIGDQVFRGKLIIK